MFHYISHLQGFITGGKDGKVSLWDELFEHCLKTYQLHSSAIETGGGAQLHTDLPAVRALSLGQNKILVGTKTSEVRQVCRIIYIFTILFYRSWRSTRMDQSDCLFRATWRVKCGDLLCIHPN